MNMDLTAEFKQAVLRDDASDLRQLLAEHPESKSLLNQPLFAFDTPAIVSAASRGVRDIAETLLDAGADINARSTWWAGSFGALDNENHDMARYLIGRGATVDAHAAARHGMLAELRALVDGDPALVHARGGDGQTPLHVAATVEIAEFLLDRGADINARDIDHESTPAQYLVRLHPDVVRFLIARGCHTDILLAAAVGDLDLVRRHLDADPDSIHMCVDSECFPMKNPHAGGSIYIWTLGQHRSPHRVAHYFGHEEVRQLLMDRTPDDLKLVQACLTGDSATVHAMLAADPSQVNALAKAHPEYVSDAAGDNNAAAVGLMLASGWPVTGDGKHTPLHWSGWNGNLEMAQVILLFDPPLETLDADYHATPLGWTIHGSQNSPHAATGDYGGVAKALLDAGAEPPNEIVGSPAVRQALGVRQ